MNNHGYIKTKQYLIHYIYYQVDLVLDSNLERDPDCIDKGTNWFDVSYAYWRSSIDYKTFTADLSDSYDYIIIND